MKGINSCARLLLQIPTNKLPAQNKIVFQITKKGSYNFEAKTAVLLNFFIFPSRSKT
jgi:hypothetical protein